ncbi:hypothetical protein BKA65DRAFT_257615 [Rhexocercosporidium sp. MPI-PUGE-AT-0058]|nr:hypothetical protein BKA65DRAFT_257615 [Rhexocercosporidium sp. MPI-PUGE-AT-0058]
MILSITVVLARETITTSPRPDQTSSESDQTTSSGYVIFYITLGIIFAVFVLAMLTGTFITHRNQRRHGTQQATQPRPRQSRTSGIDRIVIESIPIVRFGEDNVKGAGQRDIEPAATCQINDGSQSTTILATSSSTIPEKIKAASDQRANTLETAGGSLSTAQVPPLQTQSHSLECSICVDDFVQGEETRMLPCTHRFHPGCIDPWLLDTSGTCPVCRYDLHVATTNNFDTITISIDQPQPLPPRLSSAPIPNVPGRTGPVEPPRVHAGREKFGAALRRLRH